MRASALFAGAGGAPRELALHASSRPCGFAAGFCAGKARAKHGAPANPSALPRRFGEAASGAGEGLRLSTALFIAKTGEGLRLYIPPFISKTDKSLPKPHTSRPLLKPPTLLHTAHRSPSMNAPQNAHPAPPNRGAPRELAFHASSRPCGFAAGFCAGKARAKHGAPANPSALPRRFGEAASGAGEGLRLSTALFIAKTGEGLRLYIPPFISKPDKSLSAPHKRKEHHEHIYNRF